VPKTTIIGFSFFKLWKTKQATIFETLCTWLVRTSESPQI